MSDPELLKELLITILCIHKELKGSDIEKIKIAKEAYQELLGGFYEEYLDIMEPQQYKAAKDDPDYFSVFIQLANHEQDQKNIDSDGEQSIPYFNWKIFTQI